LILDRQGVSKRRCKFGRADRSHPGRSVDLNIRCSKKTIDAHDYWLSGMTTRWRPPTIARTKPLGPVICLALFLPALSQANSRPPAVLVDELGPGRGRLQGIEE